MFLLLLAASGIAANSNGQGVCGTDIRYQQLKLQYPEIAIYEQQLEAATRAATNHLDIGKLARTTAADTIVYDVPVVVHVVHDYGYEYLTDDAIFEAAEHWSQVFECRNTDTADVIDPFKKYVGNARIRFHLATIDPNGNPTKGITHEHTYLTANADDNAKLGGWPQDQYINLWFINKFTSDMTGAAAYAYYPSSAAFMPEYDGVIGLANYLDYAKAIPHELGHVLNLSHTWGSTNSPGIACGDDNVDDTPPTVGHSPVGCVPAALYDMTCAGGYSKTYKDIHFIDSVVNYPDTVNAQNIMDYTYCQKMFSKGQAQRMRIALTDNTASRNNLYTSANLLATGALAPKPDLPPIADFSVERGSPYTSERGYFMCSDNAAASFVFKNRSWNDTITGISWTFSNTPTYTTSTNGTVNNRFSDPGWVTVTLTATGNNTGATTLTDSQAVYVADTAAISPWGYTQNFSSKAAMSNWPMFNYYKNDFKWEWYNGAGYKDGACVRYRSFDNRSFPASATGTPNGDHDDIISPAFNLKAITGADVNINFYTSGSSVPGFSDDSLQVMISTNCGISWQSIATLQGSDLSNVSPRITEFVPTSLGQWKAQTVNVPTAYRTGRAYIKFRYWPSANGNNCYLDRVQVSPYTTDVNEVANNPELIKIYPNPAHDNCNMVFTAGEDGKVNLVIRDITGKLVYNNNMVYQPGELVQHQLEKNLFPAPGIYLITIIIADKTSTQKLIVN